MEIFIFWVLLSIIAGVIATNKGRSGVGFFFLALLLSPIIGILAALAVSRNEEKLEEAAIEAGDSKKCPYCAEMIKAEAIVCRFCGKDQPVRKSTPEEDGPDYRIG